MRKIKAKEKLSYARKIRRIQKGFLYECKTDEESMSIIRGCISDNFKGELSTEFRNKILWDIIYSPLKKGIIKGFSYIYVKTPKGNRYDYDMAKFDFTPEQTMEYIFDKIDEPGRDLQFETMIFKGSKRLKDDLERYLNSEEYKQKREKLNK